MTRRPPPPRTPWSIAIRRLLSDGEWHDRDELLAVASRAVPPGVAWRRAEQHRIQTARVQRSPMVRVRGDVFSAIKVGEHRVAYDALRRTVQTGAIERDGNKYRVMPGFSLIQGES